MPLPDVIREGIDRINGCRGFQEPASERGEIWIGQEYGGKFELIKVDGTVDEGEGSTPLLILTLKGRKRGKNRLLADFVNALGEPTLRIPEKHLSRNAMMLCWGIDKEAIEF